MASAPPVSWQPKCIVRARNLIVEGILNENTSPVASLFRCARIGLRRLAVPCEAGLERVDDCEELARRRLIAHAAQNVALSTHQLVRLRENLQVRADVGLEC